MEASDQLCPQRPAAGLLKPSWAYGRSENATSRATLRAEAMSRAVSSMVAVLFGSRVASSDQTVMQIGCQYGTGAAFRISQAPLARFWHNHRVNRGQGMWCAT